MAYTINKSLQAKFYGNARSASKIRYIVVHYTANSGKTATAKSNANYFANSITRKASAHYVVDENSVIYQCVPDLYAAYAVGDIQKYTNGGASMRGIITNACSISIEMVSHTDANGAYYIPEATQEYTKALILALRSKYGLGNDAVYRHFDVTGKLCPQPLVDPGAWNAFKEYLEEEEMLRYKTLNEIPNEYGFRDIINTLMDAKIINGDGSDAYGNNDVIDLSHDQVRSFVMEYRGGAFDRKLQSVGMPPAVNL